jgi:hypothetical protein
MDFVEFTQSKSTLTTWNSKPPLYFLWTSDVIDEPVRSILTTCSWTSTNASAVSTHRSFLKYYVNGRILPLQREVITLLNTLQS